MTSPQDAPTALSNADIAILSTLGLQKRLDSGEKLSPDDFQLVPRHMLRPLRPLLDPGLEIMIASGPCRVII